jgi:hypothetical protein
MTRVLLCLSLLLPAGCRSFQRGTSGDGDRRDPLYGKYIPKTDLPVPGRKDPLYTAPVSDSKKPSQDQPFRNSKATSVAGLAGNIKVEDTGMSLGDRRPNAEPVPRGVPLTRSGGPLPAGDGYDRLAEELQRRRVRYDDPQRDAQGGYSMTGRVAHGADGQLRQYVGIGATPAAAAKDLLLQLQD